MAESLLSDDELVAIAKGGGMSDEEMGRLSEDELTRYVRTLNRIEHGAYGVGKTSVEAEGRVQKLQAEKPIDTSFAGALGEQAKAFGGELKRLPGAIAGFGEKVMSGQAAEEVLTGFGMDTTSRATRQAASYTAPQKPDEGLGRKILKYGDAAAEAVLWAERALTLGSDEGRIVSEATIDMAGQILRNVGELAAKPSTTLEEKPGQALMTALDVAGAAGLVRGGVTRAAARKFAASEAKAANEAVFAQMAERDLFRESAAVNQEAIERAAGEWGVAQEQAAKAAQKTADVAAQADVYPFNLMPGGPTPELGARVQAGREAAAAVKAREAFPFLPESVLGSSKQADAVVTAAKKSKTVTAAALKAAEDVVGKLEDASNVAAKAGDGAKAETVRKAAGKVEALKEKLAKQAGKTVQEQLDEIREGRRAAQDKALAAVEAQAKRSGQAGFINRDDAIRAGLAAVGMATGAAIGPKDDDDLISYTGLALGGLWGLASARGVKAGFTSTPLDVEKSAGGIVERLLPDRWIKMRGSAVGKAAPAAGATLGAATGAAVGGFDSNDEFSLPGALLGAGAGALVGVGAGNMAKSQMGQGYWNPRKAYQRMFKEGGSLPADVNAEGLRLRTQADAIEGELSNLLNASKDMSRGHKAQVERVFRGEADITSITDPTVREHAARLREVQDKLSTLLVEVGIAEGELAEEIVSNLGTYMPRMYLYWENNDAVTKAANFLKARGERISGSNLGKLLSERKDLPEDVRAALQEISDEFGRAEPTWVVTKKGIALNAAIESRHLQNFVAASPDYVAPQSVAEAAVELTKPTLKAERIKELEALAEGAEVSRAYGGAYHVKIGDKVYRQLPDSAAYGPLRNRFIDEGLALEMVSQAEAPGWFRQALNAGTAAFKQSKLIYNPATFVRNIGGGIIQNDIIGGISPARIDKYADGIRDYVKGGGMYEEATEAGLHGGGATVRAEVADILEEMTKAEATGGTVFSALEKWTAKVASKMGDTKTRTIGGTAAGAAVGAALGDEEGAAAGALLGGFFGFGPGRLAEAAAGAFRQVSYNHARKALGMDPAGAVEFAKRVNFDYREVPRWIKMYRTSPIGAPFITFSYKALPRFFEAATDLGSLGDTARLAAQGKPLQALNTPLFRFWKYPFAMAAANEMAAMELGVPQKGGDDVRSALKRIAINGASAGLADAGDIKKYMPDYWGDQQMLLGYRDHFDRLQFRDLTYWLPWGDIGEVGKGRVGEALAKAGVPFPRQFEPSNPWLNLGVTLASGGKDPFTGKPIIPPEHESGWAALDHLKYLYRLFGPPLMPGAGFAGNTIEKAFSGDVASDPSIPSPAGAIRSKILGDQVRPLDLRQGLQFKRNAMQQQIRELDAQLRKPGISDGKRQQIIDRQKEIIAEFNRKFPKEEVEALPPIPAKLQEALKRRKGGR